MSQQSWQVLLEEIVRSDSESASVPKPNETDLLAFESANRFQLPLSYKSFILLFGPGDLAEGYLIFSPDCPQNPTFDMALFNEEFKKALDKNKQLQRYYKDVQKIRRLVIFCRTVDNDYFAWDTEDDQDQMGELVIYHLPRMAEDADVVSKSFDHFIRKFCLGNSSVRVFIPARTLPQSKQKKTGKGKSPKQVKKRKAPPEQ